MLGEKLGHAGLVVHVAEPAGRADREQHVLKPLLASAEGLRAGGDQTPSVMAMAASISGPDMPM